MQTVLSGVFALVAAEVVEVGADAGAIIGMDAGEAQMGLRLELLAREAQDAHGRWIGVLQRQPGGIEDQATLPEDIKNLANRNTRWI